MRSVVQSTTGTPTRLFSSSAAGRGRVQYADYVARTSALRKPSAIRALQPLLAQEGMISLGGGMPNPDTFPFAELTLKLAHSDESLHLDAATTRAALQYSPTPGMPDLVQQLTELQQREHHGEESAVGRSKICVGGGSQDVLTKTFEMLLDPQDTLLIENPTHSGSLASGFVPIKTYLGNQSDFSLWFTSTFF